MIDSLSLALRKASVSSAFFDCHPRPWRCGECHETMARIMDANGAKVLTVHGSMLDAIPPEEFAAWICESVNREAVDAGER